VGPLMTKIAAFSALNRIRPHYHQDTHRRTFKLLACQRSGHSDFTNKVQSLKLSASLHMLVLSSVLVWIDLHYSESDNLC